MARRGRTIHRGTGALLGLALLAAAAAARPPGRRGLAPFLPRAHVETEDATYYVFRDDVILFPISFSIPKELILRQVPEKTAFAVNDSQKSFTIKNYRFGPMQEKEYHLNIQKTRFGDTRRKGGHDCLRHYEYLANGCVPVFDNLENIPRSLLTTLPRDLLARGKELFSLPWTGTQDGRGECTAPECWGAEAAYDGLGKALLNYTGEKLSTEHSARYLLDSLNIPVEGSKVLFLTCRGIDNFPQYLTASVFHGLVGLLGDRVLDVPSFEYMYKLMPGEDESAIRGEVWGQGYSLGFRLPRRDYLDRENISERIMAHEFDLVIFARMSPYEPCNFWFQFKGWHASVPEFFEDVLYNYPRERVALLYGDDSGLDDAVVRVHASRMGAQHRGVGYIFMRELLPYPSDGPLSEAVRPVDERLLQPGCFYQEWRDFFKFWHGVDEGSGGLLECAARGNCSTPEVEAFLESPAHTMHYPPADKAILKQYCRTGLSLKAAFMVRLLGPERCRSDVDCHFACMYVSHSYSRSLFAAPAENFFAEFGMAAAEVLFAISMGCMQGKVAIQPAMAEERDGVAIVAEGALPTLPETGGPLAGEFQSTYLMRQGYKVLLVNVNSTLSDTVSDQIRYAPQLRMAALTAPGDPCAWLREVHKPLHYAHFELQGPASASAVACLSSAPGGARGRRKPDAQRWRWRPPFVSLQLSAQGMKAEPARLAVERLLALGYRRFKVTHLASNAGPAGGAAVPPLGAVLGDLAADTAEGPVWRLAAEVLPGLRAGTEGCQLLAAL